MYSYTFLIGGEETQGPPHKVDQPLSRAARTILGEPTSIVYDHHSLKETIAPYSRGKPLVCIHALTVECSETPCT